MPLGHADLRKALEAVAAGDLLTDEALARILSSTFVDVGDAKVDVGRELRTGQPEIVYGPGKTPAQVASIVEALIGSHVRPIVVSRATVEQFRAAVAVAPEAIHRQREELIVLHPLEGRPGRLAVVAAGTSDLRVAEEAALVAEAFGIRVDRIVDVGVAGIHRLLASRPALEAADCVVVVAGMEGALPSVVAGLVSSPVIAVPTSVGYGASFGGLAALLGMLSACVPGVVVVNVDNGVGAALSALRILDA
ncbi:MAG TPA: nickel pincer cofactor biosynthesis protein LarB [Actinomycetota bacterium]